MDRRVKERLVGATILVVIMVLLVPELLSGPKPSTAPVADPAEPVRNVTVDLSTQSVAASIPAQEPAPPVSATESPASTASAPPSAPPSATAPSTPQAQAPPAELETPSPPPTSTAVTAHRSWAVQAGSFASRGNADKLVRQLKAQGFSAYVLTSGSGASLRHKVRIGPIADRSGAERAVGKLKALKVMASIVAPAS
jgi:DedD protein